MSTQKNKIRLAIIGMGKMGKIHYKAAKEIENRDYEEYYKGNIGEYLDRVIVDSLVDINFEKDQKNSDGVYEFSDYKKMLKKRKIDLAVIAVPTVLHFEVAKFFLENGIHVLIEKPVGYMASEIKMIKKLADDNDLFVLPGHIEIYNPVTFDVLEDVKYNVYGKLKSYEFKRTSPVPERIPDSIIIDKLIHDLYLMILIFGNPTIDDVKFKQDKNGRVTECDLYVKHKNGLKGRILSSWDIEDLERSLFISSSKADIYGDFLKKELKVNRIQEIPKTITGYMNNQIKDQLTDFIAGSYGVRKPLVSIDDAIKCAVIIDKINKLIEKL